MRYLAITALRTYHWIVVCGSLLNQFQDSMQIVNKQNMGIKTEVNGHLSSLSLQIETITLTVRGQDFDKTVTTEMATLVIETGHKAKSKRKNRIKKQTQH